MTKGWEIIVQWKGGRLAWISLKYMKNSYPVYLAKYLVHRYISGEP